MSPFSKRFFNQLNTKAGLLITKNIKSTLFEFNECQPFTNFSRECIEETYPIKLCRTEDQKLTLQTLIKSFENIFTSSSSQTQIKTCVSLIEGLNGRGKVTAIILGVASALKYGLADIYIIGPNNATLEKCCSVLKETLLSLGYEESVLQIRHQDKFIILEMSNSCTTQKVRFINFDQNFAKYDAGLVCILEAGHLSGMQINKILTFNPKLIWVSITTGGYQSIGSTEYNQICRPLRAFCGIHETLPNKVEETVQKSGMIIRDIFNQIDNKRFFSICVTTPIIFQPNDSLESCLNDIFCLQRKTDGKTSENVKSSGIPDPNVCDLMYIDKKTLFSGHSAAEILLEKFMDIYTSFDHKRNNAFLKELSDEPAHHLFCLQPHFNGRNVPEILCIAHVCIEDQEPTNKPTIMRELQNNTRLAELKSGKSVRVVRLITRGKFKKMGYGRHLLKVLCNFFAQQPSLDTLSDHVLMRKSSCETSLEIQEMPKLLINIKELPPAPFQIDYICCNFPANYDLLCFWKKSGFYPVQIKPLLSSSEILCTMIRDCAGSREQRLDEAAYQEMCENISPIILHDLPDAEMSLVHEILFNRNKPNMGGFKECSLEDISRCLDVRQLKKLNSFVQNIHSFESVQDIIYHVAQIYFSRKISGLHLPKYQELTLVGFGLQLKSSKQLAGEMILMERIQNTNIIDPFNFKKDVQKKVPLLLSHIRECARVFLNHIARIIEDEETNMVPEKKRRLV